VSLLISELDGKTYATCLIVYYIAKNLSIHNELFSFHLSFSFDIFLRDDLSSHNEDKDGDKKNCLHMAANSMIMLELKFFLNMFIIHCIINILNFFINL
jgi:hypothetical protein